MNWRLGKLLFPRLPPDLQRRKINTIVVVLVLSALFGALLVLMMLINYKAGTR
jgi:hypothetical protein